jgi:GNAT superfamily N-acetyltransferase
MEMINDESYLLLTAKEDNKIIGSVLGIICKALPICGRPFMVVEDVIVDEQYRRKGVGKKLFDKLDEFAKENNCLYSILVSSGFRHNAHIFYENIGYTDDVKGFRKMY